MAGTEGHDGDELVGRTLAGRFTIERRLGEGGMAVVYVARQAPMDRLVALKVIRVDADGEAVRRFEKEAQLVGRLTHPNIVTLFDSGRTDDGLAFIAMERVDGAPLSRVIEGEGPLPAARVIELLRSMADALRSAHAAGVLHRDLKPDNVIVGPGVVKVLDFGLARSLTRSGDASVRTQADVIVGTPAYMSPERIEGRGDDARGDLYSLGVVGYEALVGANPFRDDSPVKCLVRHLELVPPPPSARAPRGAVPPALDDLVMRLIEKDPEKRPASAAAVLELLAKIEAPAAAAVGRVSAMRPRTGATVAAAAVALVGVTVALVSFVGSDSAGRPVEEARVDDVAPEAEPLERGPQPTPVVETTVRREEHVTSELALPLLAAPRAAARATASEAPPAAERAASGTDETPGPRMGLPAKVELLRRHCGAFPCARDLSARADSAAADGVAALLAFRAEVDRCLASCGPRRDPADP